jgi:cytochrome c oxidase subunit 3
MEIGLIVLAIMLASFLGWLLKQSFNTQPWVPEIVEETAHQAPFNARPKVVALTTFLAVATSFFALVLSAYSLRMDYGDWVPLTEPQLLWVNTGVLILASVAFQWTRGRITYGIVSRLTPGLVLSGLLTIGFLVGQLIVWQQLYASGEYITTNPSNGFFYLLTGLHGLHILGGMYVWARALVRVIGGSESESVKQSIELCTIYWHFLLIVWLIIFGFMLAT